MSERSTDHGSGMQPTQRIDVTAADSAQDPPTQALPVQSATGGAAVPPSYPTVTGDRPEPSPRGRRRWPIVVAIVAAVAVVAALIGGVVYSHKHSEALARCRTAVTAFSDARKALLATSDDSPAIQKLIRDVLGVDDILDAAAKAATAAEGTVSEEGCATNATIIQLNLVADTLTSATDSLRASTAQITQKGTSDTASEDQLAQEAEKALGDAADTADDAASDTADESANESADGTADSSASAKEGLRSALDQANDVLDELRTKYDGSAIGAHLADLLQKAVDAGQRLIDDSGVKDSKVYKAAEVTVDEALEAVNGWIDAQAAKAR